MRDPKRIKTILELIEKLWLDMPDLRLCQLLSNCFGDKDLYYIEDDVLEKQIKRTYKKELERVSGKLNSNSCD